MGAAHSFPEQLENMLDTKPKTAGQIVYDLLNSNRDLGGATLLEFEQERLKQAKFEEDFIKQVEREKKRIPDGRDFYIEMHHLSPDVFRGEIEIFPLIARLTCPAPTFNQVVYIYYRQSGEVELIWSIPHIKGCVSIYENLFHLEEDQKKLAQYVIQFKEGTLFKNAKKINKDLDVYDSSIVIA